MQNNIDIIRELETEAYLMADSARAEEIKSLVNIEHTENVESEFSELLKLISDADLREKIDLAVGRISYAYERLGFVEGFITKRSIACNA